MNNISDNLLKLANEQAIYNIYLYLAHKTNPAENETLQSIVSNLNYIPKHTMKDRDIRRLKILNNFVNSNSNIANSRISNLTRSKNGLTACVFTKPDNSVSVVFRGTGSGEWIDNGESLSGIPEENTYITYEQGKISYSEIVKKDYASDQQVEALNWFNRVSSKNQWDYQTNITVSGHSKGGNKAQFISIHSDLIDNCCSFDGQGFSPEALNQFENKYGAEYEKRRKNIYSFCADDDYVNVWGNRLVPDNQVYYFKSQGGIHYMDSILDIKGIFRPQSQQGKLSIYAEDISKELMRLKPSIRQYATLGIMNIFQKHLGNGIPVNGDAVSLEQTIAGIGVVVGSFLNRIGRMK